jgi:signal transduction histidine kinase
LARRHDELGTVSSGTQRLSGVPRRARVWLVEDSPMATANVTRVLGGAHDLSTFVDGETMIERLAATPTRPDVLITDWELPGMSGIEIVRFVRSRYDEITLPVLMLTGVLGHDRASFSEPFEAGANDYLSKPYNDLELFARVGTLVRVSVQAQRLELATEFEKQLIGIVSHDLLNPVTSMTVGAQVLLRRALLDDASKAITTRIRSSGERCARMIRDLLDFTSARLGGGISIAAREVDGKALARDVLEEVRLNNGTRVLHLETVGDTRAHWDADRIAQVLTNLIVNALKYGDRDAPIAVTIDGTAEQWITLSVHNDGPPILPALRDQLFEPMQRGDPSSPEQRERSSGVRSVGLGLFIVKNIVEGHGGTILLHSEPGAGTTFSAHLPRTTTPA